MLDACLDSAPFGDENAWTHPPTSGFIEGGWMWGRGSADSKVAVAIFCRLATRLAASAEQLHGSLVLLFDLDEHTGRFGGAKAYGLGIPATAGFGVTYAGLHATDERIQLDTIPTTQAVYHATLLSLLTAAPDV